MSTRAQEPEIVERTFQFALMIVNLCRQLDRGDGVLRTISRQLIRSGTSVGANVTEAQAGHSRADFIAKMSIALKESRETLYWLRIIERSYATIPTSKELQEADELSRILGAIVRNARRNGRGDSS
jgi:four helix bundle protein